MSGATIACDRPGGAAAADPYRFSNFNTRVISFTGDGTAVASVFPLVVRVATLSLQANAGLISLSLASSIINAVAADICGIFVALDRGPSLSLDGMASMFLSHIAEQNSIVGLPASSSRTNTLAFGDQTIYPLPSGQRLALYACSANDATNRLSAVLSVNWIPR
jgi:hypothetical protein